MDKKKLITLLLTLAMILSLATGASAAETTEARVPVTLTVVNVAAPISCTVPACLPVSLVDGAFPAIAAEKNLAIRYKAKVSASEAVTNVNAATIVFTIAAVSEKEAA